MIRRTRSKRLLVAWALAAKIKKRRASRNVFSMATGASLIFAATADVYRPATGFGNSQHPGGKIGMT